MMRTINIGQLRRLVARGFEFDGIPSAAEALDVLIKELGYDIRIESNMNNTRAEITFLGYAEYFASIEEALDALIEVILRELEDE